MERASLSVEWLELAMIERGWTNEYVAEQVDTTVRTVQRWKSGENLPDARHFYQLCILFGRPLPPDWNEHTTEGGGTQREERQTSLIVSSIASVSSEEGTCTRFLATDLTVRLQAIIWSWSFRNVNARYHELQTLLEKELRQKDNTTMQVNPINRRNALRRIALLPINMYSLSVAIPTALRVPDEFLPQCAAGITACWHLRKGKDLAFACDAVSRYIPTLQELVKNGKGTQRIDAAELLVQSFLLKSTVLRHVDGSSEAVIYAQQAERYSELVGNLLLQVLALRTLAATYYYGNQWEQAAMTVKKAHYVLKQAQGDTIPLLVQSYVYAGLATYQAYIGNKQDALSALRKAHTTFFAQPALESVPIWIDHNEANLMLNDGMTHYHLGLQKEALNSFAQTKKVQQDNIGRIEILIDEVTAELERNDQSRDMEFCIDRWTEGIEGAKTLQSNQRFNEAVIAYTVMRVVWPGDRRIMQLRELIKHW
jgi:transcriptional regulator with XRE-family HTH domain